MNMTKSMKTAFSTEAVCTAIAFSSVATVNASEKGVETVNSHQQEKHQEHEKKGHNNRGHKNEMKRMAKFLSLSEEQKVKIKGIKKAAKQQGKMLKASMKEFKITERKLLQTKVFDEKSFNKLYNSYQTTFTQLALTRAKSKHAVFNVLTTEQQGKWLKMMEHNKKKGAKERRGK
jgi:Spy/CpxP family protein refolding chaperone